MDIAKVFRGSFSANWGDYFSHGISCDCEILRMLSNLRCKGNWHSGVNNLDIESISVKKAKSQITVTEDVFSWEQTFCIRTKSRSVVALLRDTSYNRLTTSLSSGLFSTLRLVFGRYKLYSECVTTTIQKQNYNGASEIHQCEWTKLCCFEGQKNFPE